jgi:hypothetical protein
MVRLAQIAISDRMFWMADRTEPTLAEYSPWLRDPHERADRIIDATERNSVIEGLPPLRDDTRERLRAYLLTPNAARSADEMMASKGA